MRKEKAPCGEESIFEWARENDFSLIGNEWDDSEEILKNFDGDLKEFGLEILLLDTIDHYIYKIVPRGILSATKYNLEKGVPY
jgi:hypothetical protein